MNEAWKNAPLDAFVGVDTAENQPLKVEVSKTHQNLRFSLGKMALVKVPFLGFPVFDIAHMGERVMLIRFKTIIRSMIFHYFLSLKMIIVKVPFSGSPIIDTSHMGGQWTPRHLTWVDHVVFFE